ncbi:acetyltransferase [Enterococcus saigonensis]|uniref:Acetyltransferase n=1 Tax=Enterococcus saigonensis TaxID=1805431 RepID=A0A679IBH5_9ENTE|nr:GNAT family N-acetyltransferase [Enterococcus saigonensis]BCA85449.1 acetyltransferase [Enterococcus saigonensis]
MEKRKIETQKDIQDLYPVVVEIWQEWFTPIIGAKQVDFMLHNYQSKENIETEIKRGARYFALLKEDEIIGYTAYEIKDAAIYISKLYIKKEFRGQGLMREIFTWYDKLSEKLGLKQRLRVNRDNTHSVAVYEHRGFKIVATKDDEIGNGFIMNDYILEK